MQINNLNNNLLTGNLSMVQQNFSTGILKKSLTDQENLMSMLFSSLKDMGIGQNIDIIA